MLNDLDGEDSLGHMYRMLYSRVCRAVKHAMKESHTIGTNIDEFRFRLDAWDDIVGVNREESLDILEDENPATASRVREIFTTLSDAFEHVEVTIGLKPAPPLSDGYDIANHRLCVGLTYRASRSLLPRQDSISYFRNLLLTKLGENTRIVTAFKRSREQRSSESSQGNTSNLHSAPTGNLGSPSDVNDYGIYPSGLPSSQGELSSPLNAVTPRDSSSPEEPQYLLSRPSTSGSGLAAGTSSSAASPNSGYPSISQLLSYPDYSLQTPSTISATSSPMTPFTPYGVNPIVNRVATPITSGPDYGSDRQRYDSIMALSPVQSEPLLAGRHQPMEPRTESSMESHFRGRSAHLEFFSTDSRSKGSPGATNEPSP